MRPSFSPFEPTHLNFVSGANFTLGSFPHFSCHAIAPRGLFSPNATEQNIRNLGRQRQSDRLDRQDDKTGEETGEGQLSRGCDAHRVENQVENGRGKKRETPDGESIAC